MKQHKKKTAVKTLFHLMKFPYNYTQSGIGCAATASSLESQFNVRFFGYQ
jgi:hypothetical protein